jgi:predicted PurR-regulated permease PerM
VLNFVPYIGELVNTVILALAAFLTFEDTGQALLVPLVFTVINVLEGNLITPWILGRQMRRPIGEFLAEQKVVIR